MNNFPHLFEPIEIGKTTVKKRHHQQVWVNINQIV